MKEKECMYIQFPGDGTGINVENMMPFPQHYLTSESFKNSKIKEIIVDFSETDYIDSLALTYLINLSKLIKTAGKKFHFYAMNERVIKIIKLTKLGNLFKNEDETLEDFFDKCSYECNEYKENDLFFRYIKKISENIEY